MWTPTHVQVTVSRAKGLKAKGAGGTNDVFATVQLGEVQFKTSVKSKSPANQIVQWLEQCDLPLPLGKDPELQLTLHHQSFLLGDLFLGIVKIPLAQLDPYRSFPEFRWYPLRSKPGQEYKMDYRGAVEIRVQFLVKSSIRPTPALHSPSTTDSTEARKRASPEFETSRSPSSTKHDDDAHFANEPKDTNNSVTTESSKNLEENSETKQGREVFGGLEELEASTDDDQETNGVSASNDNLQESLSHTRREDSAHENICTSEHDQHTDIPSSSSVVNYFNDNAEAKPEINQSTYYQEYDDADDSKEPAAVETRGTLPEEISDISLNPFNVRATKFDSREGSYQESINSIPVKEQPLVEPQLPSAEANTMSKSCHSEDSDVTLQQSLELLTRTSGEGEQAPAVHSSKHSYENLPTQLLVNEIVERDEVIAELKEYIDLLVSRVMDFCPGVLLHPVPSLKK